MHQITIETAKAVLISLELMAGTVECCIQKPWTVPSFSRSRTTGTFPWLNIVNYLFRREGIKFSSSVYNILTLAKFFNFIGLIETCTHKFKFYVSFIYKLNFKSQLHEQFFACDDDVSFFKLSRQLPVHNGGYMSL